VTKDRASAAYRRTYIPMHTSRTNINVNVIPTTCRYCMFNVRQNSTRFTNYAGVVRTFEPRRKGGESEKGKGSLWRCLSYRGSAGGYLLIECRGVAALQVRSSQ